jgi:hypothetical protein
LSGAKKAEETPSKAAEYAKEAKEGCLTLPTQTKFDC